MKEKYGFIKEYFPDLKIDKQSNPKQEYMMWERFIDMCCMLLLFQKENNEPMSRHRRGALLNDYSLMEALEPYSPSLFSEREYVRQIFDRLSEYDAGENRGPLGRIILAGLLKPVEVIALVAAFLIDQNRKYERIFAILQEETNATGRPTVGLVCDICSLFCEEDEIKPSILWNEDSFLNRFILEKVQPEKVKSRLSAPLILHKRVLKILSGDNNDLGSLSCFTESFRVDDELSEMICHEAVLDEMIHAYAVALGGQEENVTFHLHGACGCGKRFLMSQLGTVILQDVYAVDISKLMDFGYSEQVFKEYLCDLVIAVIMENKLLYLYFPKEDMGQIQRLRYTFAFLQDYLKIIFVGSGSHLPEVMELKGTTYRIEVPQVSSMQQKKLWEIFALEKRVVFEEGVDFDKLVSKYNLTPGKIKDVINCIYLSGDNLKENEEKNIYLAVGEKELQEQIIRQTNVYFGEYATLLKSKFTLDDLQLSPLGKSRFIEAMNRVKYRSCVNDHWGFATKLPYGNGLSIVFYGPPGTGKTMAAQVMSNELGLPLYRVDLSQIGSKYIGETEKNLKVIFDAARSSNAILFFDEADSLFAKRTEVGNSNDKHANTQTSYLLQKIEEYTGMSILTTNAVQNFDAAFKRRITYMIPIEQPDEVTRLKLWQSVFPAGVPVSKDVDLSIFARKAELTGAGIKSAALSAAYCAAAKGTEVCREDLIEAIDSEYRKTGRLGFRNEFYG